MNKKNHIIPLAAGILAGAMLTSTAGAAVNYARAYHSDQPIYLDGKRIDCRTYNIENQNYIRLADLCGALGVECRWDSTTNSVYLGKRPQPVIRFLTLYDLPQLVQPQKERVGLRGLVRQSQQDVQTGSVHMLVLHIFAVSHVLHQPLERGKTGKLRNFCEVGLQRSGLAQLPRFQCLAVNQGLEDRLVLRFAQQKLGQKRLFDLQVQLVIEVQKVRPLSLEQLYRHQNPDPPRVLRRCPQLQNLLQVLQEQAPT